MTITAVILTYNEERFIGGCLQSLRALTSDVIVLDSHSSDRTRDIAESLGACVEVRDWQGFASARNAALELAHSSDWVLFVDADERIPSALAQEIVDSTGSAPLDVSGYWIPRKNVICGRIMRAGGWWPDFQLRLLRPERCAYQVGRQVHEFASCSGTTLALNSPFIHLNYRTWREFARKQFGYAKLATHTSSPVRARSLVSSPARTFWRHAVAERGYLDGLTGMTAAGFICASDGYRVWSVVRANR